MTNYNVIQESGVIVFEERPRRRGWLLALGILVVVAGAIGMIAAFAFTLAGVIFFGSMLLVGGIFQLIHGIMAKESRWVGTLPYFALAILYILMGSFIIWDPLAASLGLAFAIAGLFAAMGGFRLVEAWPQAASGLALVLARAGWRAGDNFLTRRRPSLAGFRAVGDRGLIAIELLLNGWLLVFAAGRPPV